MYAVLLLALTSSIVALPREFQERGLSPYLPGPEDITNAPNHQNQKVEDVPELDYSLISQIFGPPPVGESESIPQGHDDATFSVRVAGEKAVSVVEETESDSECVPYYICKNGVIVTDGTGIIDIRTGVPQRKATPCTRNADCTSLYEICCNKPTANHGVDHTTNNDLIGDEEKMNTQPPTTTEASVPVDSGSNEVIKPTSGMNEDKIEDTNEPLSPTKGTSSCVCVPFYLCNGGIINTDGTGLLDVRMGRDKNPNEEEQPACFDPIHVCCTVPTTASTNPTETTEVQLIGENNNVTETPEDDSNGDSIADANSEKNDTIDEESQTINPETNVEEVTTSCISTEDPRNTYGIGLIDIRIKSDGNRSDDQENSVQNVTMEEEVTKNCSFASETCCPQVTTESPPTSSPYQPSCGRCNHQSGRITNFGTDGEAEYLEFPWMVAILRKEEVSDGTDSYEIYLYQCGGSLIHNQVVLTAAHCILGKDTSKLYVRLGEYDTQQSTEPFPHEDIQVINIAAHEAYYSGALFNDVALLFLEREVELGPNIDTICLPEAKQEFDHASHCLASGWGKDKFGKEGMYQNILKKVDLSIVPHDVCQQQLRATRLGKWFRLHPSFTCAGSELSEDTCKGDGGSPLVCPISKNPLRYAQVGIVAWGIGCGENGIPGVYVDVTKFVPWIHEKIKDVLGVVISTYEPSTVASTGTVTPEVETSLVTPTTPDATTTAAQMAITEPHDVEKGEDEIHHQFLEGNNQKKQKNKHKARKEHRHRWRKEKKEEREKKKEARKKERKESKRDRKERRKEWRKYRQQRWERN